MARLRQVNQVRRRRSAAAAQTTTLREPRLLEGPFLHFQPRRPCNLQGKRAPGYIRHKAVRGGRTCANSRWSHWHVYYLAVFPEMATTIAGGEAFHRWRLQSPEGPLQPGSATQNARSIKFSKTGRYRVPSTLARRQQFSWWRNCLTEYFGCEIDKYVG